MKVGSECIPCLFERAKFECDLVFDDEEAKVRALVEVMNSISPLINPDIIPAVLGTMRERLIRKIGNSYDPYHDLKVASDDAAFSLLPVADAFYKDSSDKTEALIRIAAAANTMEYGVMGHDFHHDKFASTFLSILNNDFLYDPQIGEALGAFDKVLYLTDNTGEVVFDDYVAKKLVEIGKDIVVAPKSDPIINDATVKDIKRSGLFDGFKMEPSGSYVGIDLDEAHDAFKELLWEGDRLVIAKGMGHYETISEFEDKLRGRLIYVLQAKCEPVSRSIGVKKGTIVSRLIN
ncbi:MAG: ARMT1-like domain-containing protein [Desulfatiglandales bacterium]